MSGTISRGRNLKALENLFYIFLGSLVAVMLLREWQHGRIQRELLNRLLIKHGVDPLPEEHPLVDAIKELRGDERENWPPVDKKKDNRERLMVHFPVPGMDILKTMLSKKKAG